MLAPSARFPRTRLSWLIALALLPGAAAAADPPATATSNPELQALREELAAMRAEYQARIAELEARLSAAEQQSQAAAAQAEQATVTAQSVAAAPPPASTATRASGSGGNIFNPSIGVVFQGQAWHFKQDPDDYQIPGFPLGGEAGLVPEGLALGETEIDISANVDDLFTAWLTVPIVVEDGETEIEIEESWIETLGLPAGLSARFGRFFSNVGYLNSKHSHAWDFVDQPLVYQAFLGSQYIDDGLQLRWLAPTDLYLEVGGEVVRGDRFPAGGAGNRGVGAQSLFAKAGGDLDDSSAWQAGLSYLHAKSDERESGAEDERLLFDGNTDLLIAEFLWKWAPNGNWKQRNFIFQSEWMRRNEDGRYLLPDGRIAALDRDQFGGYVQAIYQPIPQWRVGARFDLLSGDNPGVDFLGTALDPAGDDPKRYTVMLDWSHSEFSRLRLQYSRDLAGPLDDNQWGLQYIFSIGAHGAHAF